MKGLLGEASSLGRKGEAYLGVIALIAGVLRLDRTALPEGTIRNCLTGSPRCRLGLEPR